MAVIKKNGSWWIDCRINGQRIRRKVGSNKRVAELAEKDLKVREARGEWLGVQQTKRITFAEFTKEFLSKQAGKAPTTVQSYEVLTRLHMIPCFGNRFLSDIRVKHIEDFIQERATEMQFSSVNLLLQRLKTILNTATRWGYIKASPAKHVKPLRVPEKEPPCMSREQVAELYQECRQWLYTLVVIGLNAGLRVGEIVTLTWEDVDFRNEVIKIRSDEDFTTKGRRNREIPMNDFLYQVLRKAPRNISSPLVIYTQTGQQVGTSKAWSSFKRALKRAGLPTTFRLHDMRHTFGTTLAAEGVDIRTIQELMGHADIKTTMQYVHAAPERMRRGVDRLRLDGTTEPDSDQKWGNMHPHGQDLDTRPKSPKRGRV